MHKLAKGLKKKKKPKKGKKGAEEDEFDPEELERYRRERAEAQEKAAAASEAAGEESSTACAGSDEWQKFQALTAGVDSILKKTQGDLDRIKSTSFFQRKAPVEDQKHKKQKEAEAVEEEARVQARRWVGFDKEGNPIERDPEAENESGIEEEEEEEGEEEEDDEEKQADEAGGGLKNRSRGRGRRKRKNEKKALGVSEEGFVDVPDDDEDHDDSAEEDIFDTTYVDVLQNIDVQLAYIPDSPTEEEIGDDPFDTTSADRVLKTVDKKGNKLVSLGNAVEVLSGRIDYVSSCKISRPRKPPRNQDLLLDEDFDESEKSSSQFGGGGGSSSVVGDTTDFTVEKTLLDDDSDLPDVPIDLTNLPQLLPPSAAANTPINGHREEDKDQTTRFDITEFEILNKEKTILEEIPDLDDNDDFDLGERLDKQQEEPISKLEEAIDPFGARETADVNFDAEIIEASFEAATFVNEEDPFDTTFADNILPGKTELKFIEKELEDLAPSEVSISLTDPAGLKRDYETGFLSSDPSIDPNVEGRNLAAAKQDLLSGSCTDLTVLSDKPIEPAEEITYVDPFDTSSVQELPPGQTELKVLERELLGARTSGKALGDASVHEENDNDDDDDDFDPRKGEIIFTAAAPPRPSQEPINFHVNFDVSSTHSDGQASVESAIPKNSGRKASRPEVLGFGTAKSVAFELPTPSKRPDLLKTTDEEKSVASTKPLTPYYSQKSLEDTLPIDENQRNDNVTDNDIDVDPFDTSFVGKVAPGKTELKLIESELLAKQESVSRLKHSTSDHDFDPRSGESGPTTVELDRVRRQSDFGGVTSFNRPKNLRSKPGEASLSEEYESSRSSVSEVNKAVYRAKTNEPTKRQESLLDAEVEVDAKPLTPRVESKNISEPDINDLSYVDPFDTSIATNILPGKAELKILENELSQLPPEVQQPRRNTIDLERIVGRPSLTTDDDDDFDPRAGEIKESKDFLSLEGQDPGDKVLTPLNNQEFLTDENVDPFDTSFASIGPGKTELKLLESELMDK